MLYLRGEVWWYKFRFAGRVFRESTKTKSKALARQIERKRHQALEEGLHGFVGRTVAAHHDGQRRVLRADVPAGDGRIEGVKAALPGRLGDAAGQLGLRGGGVGRGSLLRFHHPAHGTEG